MSKATEHIKTHEEFMKEVEKDWAKGDYSRFYPPEEANARVSKAFENLFKGVGVAKPRKKKGK
ncbi:MAG TPA: hypothetical protein PLL99_01575 [Chitinophagales bacterium]|jgi:hypothetical protein|nr:hypothetical protein [Chitinophagales bacterium]